MSDEMDQDASSSAKEAKTALVRDGDAAPIQTYREIAAKNINTLSEINRQLPKLLTWFAIALTQLTNNPIRDNDQEDEPDTLASRQATFRKYALYVGTITEEIRDELNAQVNDLARYKVIPRTHSKYAPAKKQRDKSDQETNDLDKLLKNGGYGDFDIGVLNARVSAGQVDGHKSLDRIQLILEELKKHVKDEANEEPMIFND